MSTGTSRRPPVRIAVVGPTATGKSELALDLADALAAAGGLEPGAGAEVRCEIVNADASQLYRGMDVGTAKLPLAERRGYPHHQVDVLDVADEANVAAYQTHARADLDAVGARGNRALVVGGSGLYTRAVTDALEFPGADPAVRAALEERAEAEGTRRLWEELREADPDAAARIDRANTRKVVRALEVIAVTGRPFSATMPRYEDLVPTAHLALRPVGPDGDPDAGRAALNARIDARAAAMFDAGVVEETRALLELGLREGATARRAIGYAQAIAVIDGALTVEQAVADTAQATRKLASRQIKWFRRDPRIRWLRPRVTADGAWLPGERERITDEALALVTAADAGEPLPPAPWDRDGPGHRAPRGGRRTTRGRGRRAERLG
ncbi:tRNA (adenosine(37)-N6)-dimethylallyltransferase MiaA [Actinomyces haliotis]|uniref:tRNA (adenosine(37)-N6)-dimethylallyltransferase MiaA n=1 Tax=Actinomyces haliotis TaxID=1280843 RepID=UPI002B267342|nr:tRNA (adenosine(37)-N6)-dimethylallyltransferase MiaA [Actinomyces haliotis]